LYSFLTTEVVNLSFSTINLFVLFSRATLVFSI
jgi:hypothetical protein